VQRVVQLVRAPESNELLEVIEQLRADILAGRVIGLAWVAMHKTFDYSVDIAGETRRSPTLTRGMLHLLDEELSSIIRGKRE
jgi:hypothetical protein